MTLTRPSAPEAQWRLTRPRPKATRWARPARLMRRAEAEVFDDLHAEGFEAADLDGRRSGGGG